MNAPKGVWLRSYWTTWEKLIGETYARHLTSATQTTLAGGFCVFGSAMLMVVISRALPNQSVIAIYVGIPLIVVSGAVGLFGIFRFVSAGTLIRDELRAAGYHVTSIPNVRSPDLLERWCNQQTVSCSQIRVVGERAQRQQR